MSRGENNKASSFIQGNSSKKYSDDLLNSLVSLKQIASPNKAKGTDEQDLAAERKNITKEGQNIAKFIGSITKPPSGFIKRFYASDTGDIANISSASKANYIIGEVAKSLRKQKLNKKSEIDLEKLLVLVNNFSNLLKTDSEGELVLLKHIVSLKSWLGDQEIPDELKDIYGKIYSKLGEIGKDIVTSDFTGSIIAARSGDLDEMRAIINMVETNNKVWPNDQDLDYNTALHIAVEKGHKDIVHELLKTGAALDIQNKDGNTALHVAAEKEKVDLFELLLEASSLDNKKIANQKKETPFDLALSGQNKDIKNIVVNFFKDKTVKPGGGGFLNEGNQKKLQELSEKQPQSTSCLHSFSGSRLFSREKGTGHQRGF